jgi:hypothetical protein
MDWPAIASNGPPIGHCRVASSTATMVLGSTDRRLASARSTRARERVRDGGVALAVGC